MARRVAAIDVGSNSVRLLVAEDGAFLNAIFRDRVVTRLLDAAGIEKTCAVIRAFADAARQHGAETIEAFGTSAVRSGANRDAILACAKDAGVFMRVLSGEEEARVAFLGAAPKGRAGVIDIGGGSTELIVGEDGAPRLAASADVGAVRLMKMPAAMGTMRAPVDASRGILQGAYEHIRAFPVDGFVGVGGSITTLAAMLKQLDKYSDEAVDGSVITHRQAKSMYDLILFTPPPLRASLKGLEKARVDTIGYGIAVLLAFFELSGEEKISVSTQDNLQGYMRAYLLNHDAE